MNGAIVILIVKYIVTSEGGNRDTSKIESVSILEVVASSVMLSSPTQWTRALREGLESLPANFGQDFHFISSPKCSHCSDMVPPPPFAQGNSWSVISLLPNLGRILALISLNPSPHVYIGRNFQIKWISQYSE